MKLTFYDYMRAGQVKRWHIVETTRQQVLAEHLWRTTVIAMELYDKIIGCSFNGKEGHEPLLRLIVQCLFSDCPEIRTGDIPTPAKAFIKELAGDVLKPMERVLMPNIPYLGTPPIPLDTMEGRIIKMADAIEAAHWISEHKVGAHADVVAQTNKSIMANLVVKFSEETSMDWFGPVNEILMALGMPYLSVSLKITPP